MKLFLLFICISFSIYSQKIPTTLYEIYEKDVKFDFSQGSERSAGVWIQGQSMPFPRYYGASVMYSRNDTTWLYVFGGDTTSRSAVTASLRYNVNSDLWEYITPLPVPMRLNSAARLGDKLYTMGGFDTTETGLKKFYEYDTNTNLWAELSELPDAIILHKAISYQDSIIYIIGGMKSDSTIFLNRVLLYNIHTQQFREATPLPEPRANFALAIVNNSIFLTGGYFNSDSLSNKTIIATIDPFDNAQLTYSFGVDSGSNYPIQVHSHFGYPKANDSINFFGGSITTAFSPVNDSYTFIVSQNIFNTEDIIPDSLSAFYAGYNYSIINFGSNSVMTIVIAGGVRHGPFITGRTWVYKDTLSITAITENEINLPSCFILEQNYPNPFNPSTVIGWQLQGSGYVSLKIYDVLGNEVVTLIDDELSAGNHKIEFNASSLSSGVYFYTLTAGEFTDTKKLLLLK